MLKKFLLSFMLLGNLTLFAVTSPIESLEKQRWEYIKTHNWTELDKMVAPYFQLAFFDGARSKEQFMIMAKTVNIQSYTFNNFKVTEGPGVAVITYDIAVSETVGGKRMSSNASRLSVWQNTNDKWLLIAHAILIPVPSAVEK